MLIKSVAEKDAIAQFLKRVLAFFVKDSATPNPAKTSADLSYDCPYKATLEQASTLQLFIV